ncbi:HAD family hydrolase [Leptospira sp. GIMC2001]|uniref:HAD family hydrolase n=1 Tax=Leptospira sp. GIMC2001 TaxID=1513297 RepID=UPI00234BEA55|nr:HAD family hydrolase [Leptospira sp. GIMC2001]WCL49432.1 HAD family hydrolase [Leptospira sp. GIMC2001]
MLLFDIDNTIIPSKKAYDYALDKLESIWTKKTGKAKSHFHQTYEIARSQIKSELKDHTSNRLRILCFKKQWESTFGNLTGSSFQKILDLESKYFEFFTEYLQNFAKENRNSYKQLWKILEPFGKSNQLVLVSNENLRTQFLKLNNIIPRDFPFHMIVSEELGIEKPDKKVFQRALSITQSKPEDSFMIGDSWEDDMKGAAKMGMQLIHIEDIFGDREYFENVGPKAGIQAVRVRNVIKAVEIAISIDQ